MATFEFTAKHPIVLDPHNRINKGETFTMNIHTLGVQPYSVFTNPESRRQAIQQFAVNGIDVSTRQYLLNNGHWDIKKVPEKTFSKSTESFTNFQDFKFPWEEMKNPERVIDDVEMKKECIELVKDFFNDGLDIKYAESGIEGRCEIAATFFDDVKTRMGVDADFSFAPLPSSNLGGYNPETKSLELNMKYLENPDCSELLNTILHELRHGFQDKCIEAPNSVTVKDNIIGVWKDNFKNYISPTYDFEAYENQEIEKDANYFADSVMRKGMDSLYA